MNLPNKLTILRIYMVPLVIAMIMLGGIIPEYIAYPIAALLFGLTALTDMIDGKIARKRNLITDFGKFLDPLADKLLVVGTMITILYKFDTIRPFFFWAVLIVVFREFMVTGIRLLAANSEGKVIAANFLGKFKTVTQIICVLIVLVEPSIETIIEFIIGKGNYILDGIYPLSIAATIVMVTFTLWSGLNYLIKYSKFLKSDK